MPPRSLLVAIAVAAAAGCARRAPPSAADPKERVAAPRAPGRSPDAVFDSSDEPPPECLDRIDIGRFTRCVSAPDANRDCGVRLGVSRTCGVLFASPWGTLDGATIGCINAGAAALRGTGGPPVALLEFPLGRPVFIAPRDGVGELKWLRRGLPKPAAAMKGAPRVAIGPATPVETGDFSVTFLDGRYRLRMSGGPLVEPYVPGVLSLQRGGRTQVLLTGVQSFRVPWAGDVDGDGRLDLLIEWTETSFARSIDLFLSRDAGEGRLVRLAATDPGVE